MASCARPFKPLPALLGLVASAAAMSFWGQDAGDADRSGAIDVPSTRGTGQYAAAVSSTSLGHVPVDTARWGPSPVVSGLQSAFMLDINGRLLQFSAEPSKSSPWMPSYTFDGASGAPAAATGGLWPTGLCVTGSNVVAWVSRTSSMLWAVQTHLTLAPALLPWAPLNLTAATSGAGFLPGSFGNEYSTLHINNVMWLPDPSQHGALVVREC